MKKLWIVALGILFIATFAGSAWLRIDIQREWQQYFDDNSKVIKDDVAALEDRASNLESQVFTLEQEIENLCRVMRRMRDIDDALVTLADSSNIWKVEKTYSEIWASQAYCQNTVAVYIDVRQADDFKIHFMESEISSYMQGFWREGLDPTVTLLSAEGEELVFFDPSPYFRRGDFMRVWISNLDEVPKSAVFYDSVTRLSISIQHLDGSMEPPSSE